MSRLGLYIHIPFCQTKCGYCDFYSVAVHHDRPSDKLLDCLLRELDGRTSQRTSVIHTIFVGGGTPTLLAADQLTRLLTPLGRICRQDRCAEFSVEANPATLDDEKLGLLTAAGVDRLSMGAQSFHADDLAVLERLHSPDDIGLAVDLARRHGLRRINLDLIFGIPGQTLERWRASLERAIALDVDHIACYGLTYEPGTRLTRQHQAGRIRPIDDALEAEMYEWAIDRLAEAGYAQYEISNFARPGQECRHNLIYWRNEEYIGVGPSAAGWLGGVRYKNVADIGTYQRMIARDGQAVIESERLSGAAAACDTLITQLRLNEGLDSAGFVARHGHGLWQQLEAAARALAAVGLCMSGDERLCLTRAGRLVADAVIARLMAELDEPFDVPPDRRLPVLTSTHGAEPR